MGFSQFKKIYKFYFYLGIAYVPHEKSKYYNSDIFYYLALDIANFKSKNDISFLIMGDFNARTSNLDYYIDLDDDMKELCGLDND